MNNSLLPVAALLLALGACQSPKTVQQVPSPNAVPPAGKVASEAEARAAVTAYINQQSNAALYAPDSARIMDAGRSFQVLVPRTDWVNRLPNRAAFDVDKATGTVSTRAVK